MNLYWYERAASERIDERLREAERRRLTNPTRHRQSFAGSGVALWMRLLGRASYRAAGVVRVREHLSGAEERN